MHPPSRMHRPNTPVEIIGHFRVLLLGLFLVVCLPPAADEECSGCTDEAQMHWRGPRTIYHSSHYRSKTFVTRRRKKDTMEKEREIRPQEGGSNGRKWLSFRAYKARSTSAETPQVCGSIGSRLRLKISCLQLTNLNVLVAHLTSCNFCCLSLLCFAT